MSTAIKPRHFAAGTRGSVAVESCQVCDSSELESLIFLGFMPPLHALRPIGSRPVEQPFYPAELLLCRNCKLVQLGLFIDPALLFPPEYPYVSGTTKVQRDDFADLCSEARRLCGLEAGDLVVDIGSNNGALLNNFLQGGQRVAGVEPSDTAHLANRNGIPTYVSFFGETVVSRVLAEHGQARLITATNVFAHVEDVHGMVELMLQLLAPGGIFACEVHYLPALLEDLQYDCIYHEHLRYYSLATLSYVLHMHGINVVHARRIPTHGGSIRIYAAREGDHRVDETVPALLAEEAPQITPARLHNFSAEAAKSKLALLALLRDVKQREARIYAIGAAPRSCTLVHYVGLDNTILDCVLELPGSPKIGNYLPGTTIPICEESRLLEDQPEYALLLSWHVAQDLIPKIKMSGFQGRFIVPLPRPEIVAGAANDRKS